MRATTETLFREYEPPSTCHFGITESIAGLVAGGLGGLGLSGGLIGTAAAPGLLATGLAGAAEGAGGGALLSEITGGNPLTGALTGGLTGGAIGGFGPELGSLTGLGTTAGDVLAGGAAGALGSAITGGNPLLGAGTGVIGGLISGANTTTPTAPSTSVSASPIAGTGGGTGAASVAPASIAAPASGLSGDVASTVAATGAGTGGAGVSDLGGDWSGTVGSNSGLFGSLFGGTAPPQVTTNATGTDISGGGSTGLFSSLTGGNGGIGGMLTNPAALLGLGGLGYALIEGQQPLPAASTLQQQEGELASQARADASYQLSGTLPPGLQNVVTQAGNNQIAAIKSRFAQLGLGGSTAESEAIGQVQQSMAGQVATIANQLAQQGVSLDQISANELNALLTAQETQQRDFVTALATFAGGLAGGAFRSTPTTTV